MDTAGRERTNCGEWTLQDVNGHCRVKGREWTLQGVNCGVMCCYLLTSLCTVRRVPKGQREEETGHWSQGRDMEALTASVDPEDKHSSVL